MISTTRTRRPRLETVQRRLDRWREKRPHVRTPLPPRLWKAAVSLVSEHGLYGTARALHLDYGTLKRHVGAIDRDGRARMTSSFVELPAPADPAYVIEVEGAHTTVRLHLNGIALTDLATLTRLVVGPAA
jgi:hypothetical protein